MIKKNSKKIEKDVLPVIKKWVCQAYNVNVVTFIATLIDFHRNTIANSIIMEKENSNQKNKQQKFTTVKSHKFDFNKFILFNHFFARLISKSINQHSYFFQSNIFCTLFLIKKAEMKIQSSYMIFLIKHFYNRQIKILLKKQSMKKRNYRLDIKSAPKYKYSFNQKTYDLNVATSLDLDKKLGITRVDQATLLPQKIKSSGSFTFDESKNVKKQSYSTSKINNKKATQIDQFKLPSIKKRFSLYDNPEDKEKLFKKIPEKQVYYQSRIKHSIFNNETNYLINLSKQHFMQSIEALRIGKTIKLPLPNKQIKLSKKNPKFKTVYLDLDQTLIHCDQNSNNYTVKLNFPLEGGSIVAAGIRVRPHCQQFIQKLSSFAEIIIFTASSSSYADVVLDYLDPQKKYFAHRLYRHHCTLQKGFYTKDLRVVNRRLQDSVLVDNSAFCYMLQPFNGIPVLPYYHYGKDKELLILLQYLKEVLQAQDVRQTIKNTFFWHKYLENDGDSRKIFQENFGKEQNNEKMQKKK